MLSHRKAKLKTNRFLRKTLHSITITIVIKSFNSSNMSKSIKLVTLLAITMLSLSACEAAPDTSEDASKPTQTSETTADQPSGIQLTDSSAQEGDTTKVPGTVQLSDSDVTAYNGAMELNDASFCDRITDQAYKDLCKNDLSDKAIIIEAVKKKDISICQGLSSNDQVQVCEIKVDLEVKSQEIAQQKAKMNEATMVLSDEIVEKGELARCAELGEDYIASCEIDILLNKAFAEKNPNTCDQASSPETVAMCKDRYEALREAAEGEVT